MPFSSHTECVAPSNYSGPFIGSSGMWAAIAATIVMLIIDPGGAALTAILGAIGYCQWWLFGRLVCLGGNECIIGLVLGVYDQSNQVGFMGKFDSDFSCDMLLAPSLLTDSVQDIAAKNTVQGHMIQDQRFCTNPVNALQADMVTMYNNFSNLSFTGETESPADMTGAAGQIDQDNNLNIGGQGVLTTQQADSLGLVAPGSLNAQGLVVPDEWQANTFHTPGDQITDSNGNLQQCTPFAQALSGANEPAWTGIVSVTKWSMTSADTFVFTGGNTNKAGDVVTISGFRDSLFFNNQTGNVLSATPNTVTVKLTPLPVGSDVPGPGSNSESGQLLTIGALTNDGSIQWAAQGPPPAGTGTFEVEFEGNGVWDLYQSLLVASVPAAIGAVVCAIPVIGWIICLICTLIALIITAIGAAIAQTDSGPTVTVGNGGTIHPGQDVLFVFGRWVLDSAHSGWNELHPVLSAQKVGTVPNANLITGNPWTGTPFADTTNLQNTLSSMCGLTGEAQSGLTAQSQSQPQNQWTLHPLVDGCSTPAAPPVQIQ